MTAANTREAAERTVRYELLADTARLRLSDTSEGTRIEFIRPGERRLALRVMNEISVACLLQVTRGLAEVDFAPIQVAFRHRAPREIGAHCRFFRAPVRFAADWDGLLLAPSILQHIPTATNANMGSFFERHAEHLLHRLRSSESLPDRVRAAIAQELANGAPTMVAVARKRTHPAPSAATAGPGQGPDSPQPTPNSRAPVTRRASIGRRAGATVSEADRPPRPQSGRAGRCARSESGCSSAAVCPCPVRAASRAVRPGDGRAVRRWRPAGWRC